MGELLDIIIRILKGEKLEKPTDSDYMAFWLAGVYLAIINASFYFKFLDKLPELETFFEWLLFLYVGIFVLVLTIIFLNVLMLALLSRKALIIAGSCGWGLTLFFIFSNVFLS